MIRLKDKGFYKKRKRDLKRKLVVCLVKKDSRVASLADKVDEDLVVVEASSVGGEEILRIPNQNRHYFDARIPFF